MGVLNGKVAIITGGTSGIGAHAAMLFSQEGAKVLIAGRREDEGRRVAETLGPGVTFHRADVTREVDVANLVARALATYHRVDCLFNNAGGPCPVRNIDQISIDDWDETIANNVRGVVLGMKHAAPVMRRQGSGSIINTASIAGTRTGIAAHPYCAAKAAVIHLSRCVAVELGEAGVRVNTLSPTVTLTDTARDSVAKTKGVTAERAHGLLTEYLAKLQPIPRACTSEDIARAALFLASDASAFLSGHDLVVDGAYLGGWKWSELAML